MRYTVAIGEAFAGRIVDMDPRVWELALLSMFACVCLGIAWVQDDVLFAVLFAAEAAWAAIEAAYLAS